MARAPKAAVAKTADEVFSHFAAKLKAQATRPNIYGYRPHDKQVLFHSSPAKGRLYIGGNRSGKTTGGIAEDIYWLTGRHPYRVTPPPPVAGRIVSVDFLNGIEKIIRPELARWLPSSELLGGSWSTAYNNQLRTLTLENGSFVEFMSYDQDLDKFAGTSRDFVHFDEEPPQDIWLENKTRLIDKGGSYWITMTPVEGMCADAETQCMTKRGWLYWYEVMPDDEILTYNIDKNRTEFLQVEAMYVNEEYSGKMYTAKNEGKYQRKIDFLCTPDHKWVELKDGVRSLKSLSDTKRSSHSRNRIVVTAESTYDPDSKYSDDFVSLIGWIVAEGHISDNNYDVSICQSFVVNPQKCLEIERLLNSLDLMWVRNCYDERAWVYSIRAGFYHTIKKLLGSGLNKELPYEFLCSISDKQRYLLLDALISGDGDQTGHGGWRFFNSTKAVVDQVAYLGTLCGYRVTVSSYREATETTRKQYVVAGLTKDDSYRDTHTIDVQKLAPKLVDYEGTVWCPHTSNETFVARRNGSIYLTGNTWVFDDIYIPGKNDPGNNISVVEVDMTENPYLHSGEVDEFVSGLSADDREARVHGKFVQIGGLIFKGFDPQIHVIDPVVPPKDWEWYASMDHGFRNPTAWLWHAANSDNRVITFAEHYVSDEVVDFHAKAVHKINEQNGRPPDVYIGDPSIQQHSGITGTSIHLEYSNGGVPILLGNNDVAAGINRMARYLEVRGDNRPSWYITRNCTNLIYEMQRYRWKTYATKKSIRDNNGREAPHKKEDHAVDSARYFFMSRPELGPNKYSRAPIDNPLGVASGKPILADAVKYDRFAGEESGFRQEQATEWSYESADEYLGII